MGGALQTRHGGYLSVSEKLVGMELFWGAWSGVIAAVQAVPVGPDGALGNVRVHQGKLLGAHVLLVAARGRAEIL